MPKEPTYPILFDTLQTVSIVKFNEWNLLKDGINRRGTLEWTTNGNKTGSCGYWLIINDVVQSLSLNYTYNGKTYAYEITLTNIPSNLGKGLVWYFICPFTGKRCRKLHLISGKFIHRSAVDGMYTSQTESKRWRWFEQVFGSSFKLDEVYKELYGKNFVSHYKEKPTKRFLKLMAKLERYKSKASAGELENILMNGF